MGVKSIVTHSMERTYRMKVFDKEILRRIFGSKSEETKRSFEKVR
jgi:hypothetical protein